MTDILRNGPEVRAQPPAGPLDVGAEVGSYRLVRLIGAGTGGRVFEVNDSRTGRRAAMKLIAGEHASVPGTIRRLFGDVRAVNELGHAHIIETTDLIEAKQ